MKQQSRKRGHEFESKQGVYIGELGGKSRGKFCNCIIDLKKNQKACEIFLPYVYSINTE